MLSTGVRKNPFSLGGSHHRMGIEGLPSSGRLLPTLGSLPKANPQQCQPPPAQASHPKPWYLQCSVILKWESHLSATSAWLEQ